MTTPSETVLENLLSKIQFNSDGLVPVMAVSHTSGTLLMQAWADADAVKEAVKTGIGVYFSRSRGQMWRKGESSGHTQKLHGIRLDCDGDSLVYLVDQTGPACHLNHPMLLSLGMGKRNLATGRHIPGWRQLAGARLATRPHTHPKR